MKRTEMEIQLILFAKGFIPKITTFLSSIPKAVTALMLFFGTFGLAPIAPLIHLVIGFVFADMLFGLGVTIFKKGWGHILSCRLRDSLVKILFYVTIIVGLFLIESVLIGGYFLTAKLAFAVIAGTELWSIMANMLVLFPNLPALKLLKKYLTGEIAKKLSINEDNAEQILNDSENDSNI